MIRFISWVLSKFLVFFSFLLCQRRTSCWKYRKWCSYFANLYHDAKILDKKTINFWSVLTCCFPEKNYQVFWSSFSICPLQLHDCLHWDSVRISHCLTLPKSVLETIGNRLASVFSRNCRSFFTVACMRQIFYTYLL